MGMKPHNPIEVGVFEHYSAADDAVVRLMEAGFPKDAISVICPTCSATDLEGVEHKQPAGSRSGAAAKSGGAVGGILGLVAATGIVASGGTALLVAGPLLAASGAVGAVTGAFIGAMLTRGFESEITNFYDQALQKGQILVAADTGIPGVPSKDVAARVLAQSGAMPIELPRG
jgi:hypothetical protein